ncbi:hypothetical protein PLESTF_001740100 [Pleodorina starrii]|nr:hypothetical protein PLESTM_002029800 [Pleodorina starrii]GLC76149.1 hypothetical protein PLESTF_001740100 [Pleodorina starrii]
MEVLVRFGPVSVAIDPQSDFMFYSEGVYYNKNCGTAVSELTHAVVLMGYGTTDDGIDYWIIKNRYGFIARHGNDCGVTTDAVFATVKEADAIVAGAKAAAKAARSKERQSASVHDHVQQPSAATGRRLLQGR